PSAVGAGGTGRVSSRPPAWPGGASGTRQRSWAAAELQPPAVGCAPPPAAGHPSHAHAPAPAWTPRAIDSPAGVGPDADLPRGLDLRREEVPAPGGTASGGRWGGAARLGEPSERRGRRAGHHLGVHLRPGPVE